MEPGNAPPSFGDEAICASSEGTERVSHVVIKGDMPPEGPVALLVTAAHLDEARSIGEALLSRRLVACVNFIPIIESHYWWKGTLETAVETLIIAKTVAARVHEVRQVIRGIHSYEVFELVVLPIIGGSQEYLDWIVCETRIDGAIER